MRQDSNTASHPCQISLRLSWPSGPQQAPAMCNREDLPSSAPLLSWRAVELMAAPFARPPNTRPAIQNDLSLYVGSSASLVRCRYLAAVPSASVAKEPDANTHQRACQIVPCTRERTSCRADRWRYRGRWRVCLAQAQATTRPRIRRIGCHRDPVLRSCSFIPRPPRRTWAAIHCHEPLLFAARSARISVQPRRTTGEFSRLPA